ncbi:uncharacterized protein LOC103376245 isoform X3 [Stegastes partitus]|uniref:Uncharacterized protein LOC103376245 isoform X3 n=1 Tax=Stegastes partitus TaxID=144197 RepID=A0A9Y4NWG4_9TELE|nr:PREDICTED: uncharacterized protein LOC103376245 isoform X3 [Stegastes partitus]
MDHQTSGQLNQPSHASSFQWLSFAYQGLTEIPYETILTQTDSLEVLDLSYNLLDEYPFLKKQKFLLEPGSVGAAGEAQHSDPGLQQLHVSRQVSLHAERHHAVHQQEQDQQPACVYGGGQAKVPRHQDP